MEINPDMMAIAASLINIGIIVSAAITERFSPFAPPIIKAIINITNITPPPNIDTIRLKLNMFLKIF